MLASVIHGCMAVASGMCRHVLVYRALNEATAWRQSTERVATDAAGVTRDDAVDPAVRRVLRTELDVAVRAPPHARVRHDPGADRPDQPERPAQRRAQPEGGSDQAAHARGLPVVPDDQRTSVPVRLRHRDRRGDRGGDLGRGPRTGHPEPGDPLRGGRERAPRPRLVGSVGGHDHHGGDERGQASLVQDRHEARRCRLRPALRRLHGAQPVLARGPAVLRQGRERRVRRGRRAHQPDRRAAAGHQRWPALGRPAAQLRPSVRGVPPVARRARASARCRAPRWPRCRRARDRWRRAYCSERRTDKPVQSQ